MVDPKEFIQMVETAYASKRRIESCGNPLDWHAKKYGKNPKSSATNADHCDCGKKLTSLHVRVAAKLAYFRRNDPKHILLAKAAGCCPGTVVRALERLRLLSLLTWDKRFAVAEDGRAFRVSNAYVLGLSREVESLVFRGSANLIPERFRLTRLLESQAELFDSAAAQKSLAEINAAREPLIAAAWAARRNAR